MASLLFHPNELLQELESLDKLADQFLDPASPFRLQELVGIVRGLITQNKEREIRIEIPLNRPLITRESIGEFEPTGKSGRSSRRVFGCITGVWEIRLGSHEIIRPAQPHQKNTEHWAIGFTGLASTVFNVIDAKDNTLVARWKAELGDANSPGYFFHTFASMDDSLPVPRHPNLFATPMSAIEFAIGELFHGKWEEVASGSSHAPLRWRSIQNKRTIALLRWQTEVVASTTSSPWCSLKAAKPSADLFL